MSCQDAGCPSVAIDVAETPRRDEARAPVPRRRAVALVACVVAAIAGSACLAAVVASAIPAGAPENMASQADPAAPDSRRLEPPAGADAAPCLDVEDGEMCYRFVRWIFEDGVRFYPEKYGNITLWTPFHEVQGIAHEYFPEICPRPCGRRQWGRSPSPESMGAKCDYGYRHLKPAHAGCFIAHEGKVLAERLTYDGQKFDIPGGQTNWREPARCTAYRETYEETGYLVAPRELLAIVRNDFHIYRCELLRTEPVKDHDHEISWVGWLGREEVAAKVLQDQWRFPEAHSYADWLG